MVKEPVEFWCGNLDGIEDELWGTVVALNGVSGLGIGENLRVS